MCRCAGCLPSTSSAAPSATWIASATCDARSSGQKDGGTCPRHQDQAPHAPAARLVAITVIPTTMWTATNLHLSSLVTRTHKNRRPVLYPSCDPQLSAGDHLPPAGRPRRRRVRHAEHLLRSPPADQGQVRPLRVRPAVRGPRLVQVRRQLLPRGDAVHPVRHRGDLPLPGGDPAEGVRNLRAGGNTRLRGPAVRRLRLRLAQRSPQLEIVRREPAGPDDFRARQLRARDMLRGDLDEPELEQYVQESVLTTTLDRAVAWARSNSLYPLTFGLACCAIEMMSMVAARVDIARFGFEAFRASPRQADMIILSGRISIKMAPVIRRIYDQMLEPKWVIAMGACSSSMGVFNNYALVPGDKFLPVDIHIPGCPPRPEALAHGIVKLRAMVGDHPDLGWRQRYGGIGTEEVVPDLRDLTGAAAVNVSRGDEGQGA